MKKNPKAIIVWDFDGVLFDLERPRQTYRQLLMELGIPLSIIMEVRNSIMAGTSHFSITTFIQELRKREIGVSATSIRSVFRQALFSSQHYSKEIDLLLHRLSAKGFLHRIVSLGIPAFQYRKILSCGEGFAKHFTEIKVTPRPKYIEIAKIKKKYPDLPLIFIDDTKENLELAKEHVPDIFTIHYSNASSIPIRDLEKKILHAAKTK